MSIKAYSLNCKQFKFDEMETKCDNNETTERFRKPKNKFFLFLNLLKNIVYV